LLPKNKTPRSKYQVIVANGETYLEIRNRSTIEPYLCVRCSIEPFLFAWKREE